MTVSQNVIEQVNTLMKSALKISPEKLVPTATLIGDLGLDSLDAVDMLVYMKKLLASKLRANALRASKPCKTFTFWRRSHWRTAFTS